MEQKEILKYQRLFMKTSSGRDIDCARIIGDDAEKESKAEVGKIMATIDRLVSAGSTEDGMAECTNCRLLLDQASFFNGCPNCGSKDFDTAPHGSEVRKQD
jgi:hypothetical protein